MISPKYTLNYQSTSKINQSAIPQNIASHQFRISRFLQSYTNSIEKSAKGQNINQQDHLIGEKTTQECEISKNFHPMKLKKRQSAGSKIEGKNFSRTEFLKQLMTTQKLEDPTSTPSSDSSSSSSECFKEAKKSSEFFSDSTNDFSVSTCSLFGKDEQDDLQLFDESSLPCTPYSSQGVRKPLSPSKLDARSRQKNDQKNLSCHDDFEIQDKMDKFGELYNIETGFPRFADLYRSSLSSNKGIKQITFELNDYVITTSESLKIMKSGQIEAQIKRSSGQFWFFQKPKGLKKAKTLIFDLDETLIHYSECDDAAPFIINFPKTCDHEAFQGGLYIRPGTKEILTQLSKSFEIIVFTASAKDYADTILDMIDPERQIIHHRLYRNHTTNVGSCFIKDLRILNRDLKDVILVDNAAISFALQINNGIPILPFYGNPNDTTLYELSSFLMSLNDIEDVRETIKELFHLEKYFDLEFDPLIQFYKSKGLQEECIKISLEEFYYNNISFQIIQRNDFEEDSESEFPLEINICNSTFDRKLDEDMS